jgi:hypothetical protein
LSSSYFTGTPPKGNLDEDIQIDGRIAARRLVASRRRLPVLHLFASFPLLDRDYLDTGFAAVSKAFEKAIARMNPSLARSRPAAAARPSNPDPKKTARLYDQPSTRR